MNQGHIILNVPTIATIAVLCALLFIVFDSLLNDDEPVLPPKRKQP